MVKILERFPLIKQTFNLVPSLIEQIEDYTNQTIKDKFLEVSLRPAKDLSYHDKEFILKKFFSINKDRVISIFPRYYELYLKNLSKKEFNTQDYLDLQVWFNLAWIDPVFREGYPELKTLVNKARHFSEEEKSIVLDKQLEILKEIIPVYKKLLKNQRIEISISPYYHPILPLIYNTNIAKEGNPKTNLDNIQFNYPKDCLAQINEAIKFFQSKFETLPKGLWPSEEAVSEHIVPAIIQSGINWIIADEAILFKSLKVKKRNTDILYQPHILKRKDGILNIIFRDRNLSDLIGFVYHKWKTEEAVNDFMRHLENIYQAFGENNILVTVAMDGENAWEYYPNDGYDFLESLYNRLQDAKFIKTTTISEYLERFPPKIEIKRLSAGSWINAEFAKWIGSPLKLRAWELLLKARQELEQIENSDKKPMDNFELAYKQIYICEGSDWFWWYQDEQTGDFDRLFRMHLSNFYTIIKKAIPEYLKRPLTL